MCEDAVGVNGKPGIFSHILIVGEVFLDALNELGNCARVGDLKGPCQSDQILLAFV